MSAHIVTVKKSACLFLKLPLPPVWGCILFANAWGSGSSRTGVSQPHVTGQESCQGEECKQWTELDSSELEECSERQCALQSLTNGMLDLLQTRERRRAGELLCNAFHWWKVWEGGVGSERGGRPGGEGGRRVERGAFWDFMFSSSPHSLQIKVAVAKVTWQRKGKYLAVFRLFLCRKLRSQRHR